MDITKKFENAVDSFLEKCKKDINIIAVIALGSFSYDKVFEKSDIDLMVILRDQEKIETKSYCIDEDNLVLNVSLVERSNFKRMLEKSSGGSLNHSFIAMGKILYSTDESMYEYFEENRIIGEADMEKSLFFLAGELIGYLEKIEKWLVVKKDPDYAKLYVLKAVEIMAKMEVCKKRIIPTREAIEQAGKINPKLIERFYLEPLSKKYSLEEVTLLLKEMNDFLDKFIEPVFNTANLLLNDGEIKTVTEITRYYNTNSHFIIHVFEYLYEKGKIEKLSQNIRITPKGKMIYEEIAFMKVEEF